MNQPVDLGDGLTYTPLERYTVTSPLGLRFWDSVTNTIIGQGLAVSAYPADDPTHEVPAISTRSGTYVLNHLPGLRAIEQGAGDAAFWATLPPPRSFVVR